MIAVASSGGFRDGLSLLDQLSAGGEAVTADRVRQLLGWGSAAEVEALYRMITEDDLTGALAQLDQLYERGAQSGQLINQLIGLVRTDLRSRLESRANTDQPLRLLTDLTGVSKTALPRYALELPLPAIASSRWQNLQLRQSSTKPRPTGTGGSNRCDRFLRRQYQTVNWAPVTNQATPTKPALQTTKTALIFAG